jgi:hypothetical protein
VSLADLNDHPPVFDKEEYEIRVPESALVNTPLTRLKVRDTSIVFISVAIFSPKRIFPARVLDPGSKRSRISNPDPQKELSRYGTVYLIYKMLLSSKKCVTRFPSQICVFFHS